MTTALLPAPAPAKNLATMTLAECPDYATAVAAGIAHGFTPEDALRSAYMKWATDHADGVQQFGLGNFYEGPEAFKQFMDLKRHIQYLCIRLADQEQEISALRSEVARWRNELQPVNDGGGYALTP